jgi:hypothetical protein
MKNVKKLLPASFPAASILDPHGLLDWLRKQEHNLAGFLVTRFGESARKTLMGKEAQGMHPSALAELLAKSLDAVMRRECIYTPERFRTAPQGRTLALLTKKPGGEVLLRLNHLLLAGELPALIKKPSTLVAQCRSGRNAVPIPEGAGVERE